MTNKEIFQLEILTRIRKTFFDAIATEEENKKLGIDFGIRDNSAERINIFLLELFPINSEKILKKVKVFVEELIENNYINFAQIILQKIVENNSVEAKSWLVDMIEVEALDGWLRNIIKEEVKIN